MSFEHYEQVTVYSSLCMPYADCVCLFCHFVNKPVDKRASDLFCC